MIKGKIKLCETPLSAFNIEMLNGIPFYERYNEFVNVFKVYGINDVEQLFAQPRYNDHSKKIEWFVPCPQGEMPIKFSNLTDDEKLNYEQILHTEVSRIKSIAKSVTKPTESAYFTCALRYIDDAIDYVYCHNGQVTFGMWGMGIRSGHQLESVITDSITDHRVHQITFKISGNGKIVGRQKLHRRHNHVLDGGEIPVITPAPRYNFVKWLPNNPQGHQVTDDIEFTAVCEHCNKFLIEFNAGEFGEIQGNTSIELNAGARLFETAIPTPIPQEGYEFRGWQPTIDASTIVDKDQVYTAIFKKIVAVPPTPTPTPPPFLQHNIHFDAGEHGTLPSEYTDYSIAHGDTIPTEQIPSVTPIEGKRFAGWDKSTSDPINEDTTFTAKYDDLPLPWYKRLWVLLTSRGCLKWLLWLLLALLILLLLSAILRTCTGSSTILPGCTSCGRDHVGALPVKTFPDGTQGDDNGFVKPITGSDGKLPTDADRITPPMRDEDGNLPPIQSNPGEPDVIANRLFLFLENENDNIDSFAQDFKKAYPGEQYQIIGFDRDVKMLVVQIPENERDEIRNTINSRIPNHKFFVFDEEVYEINGYLNNEVTDAGWHLKAIHLNEGWKITQGSSEVKIAVVDDGIDASHDMFKGRITEPYNVFTQNNKLSVGEGHGTHTAALAAGSADFSAKGAAGVAPKCQLIPVQVFDNKQCPMSALVAGIMYAVHQGADVINVSVGPSFSGLNSLPVSEQERISKTQFQNVALLWNRVSSIAAKKKSIIVFAAGNDDILSSIPPENRNATSIVVTAVEKRLYPTEFTNYGPCSDISAPGANIYSAFPTNSFRSCNGTSMAAPIVSGTVALMKSLKKDLTVEQARIALFNSGADVYGYIPPMVLVDKALLAVQKGDYTKQKERTSRSVPEEDIPTIQSGGGIVVVPPEADVVEPGTVVEVPANPERRTPVVVKEPIPANNGDYDEIRRLIREYEKKIDALKKRLPR
mgnify:CR=1 FL=1